MTERRVGTIFGASAYVMWGLFPLYWPLLEPAGAFEILAHRIVWSLVVIAVILTVRRNWSWIARYRAQPRRVLLLALAAVLVAVNWAVYIWGVNSGHVVETSLGYFINPLVLVVLGATFLGERLRRLQWAALGLALVAVIVLTVDYGHPPYIALTLAASFGSYGLVKKKANAAAVEGLEIETSVLFVPALAFLIVLQSRGTAAFGHHGVGNTLLLAGAGVVTAVPLLFFGGAVTRVPLSIMGVMQYVTPILQFGLGVLLRHEPMPAGRLAGFALVWVALALFTAETVTHHRRQLRPAVEVPV
ncbi:MAG: chloramphenicol-sensitive protein RarD [Frankiaceae bacterium]|nr:chloramphenicol-sensitive protein RarD [Frankiaceae bacterium]